VPLPPLGTGPRVLEATRRAIAEQTGRSTGTVTRLRHRVEQLLAGEADPPQMRSRAAFYRLVAALSAGKHTVGSARTRRSLAKQPEGPFGMVTAARPGEWTEIDSTPLDVRVVLDDGTVDRVELTGLVDLATPPWLRRCCAHDKGGGRVAAAGTGADPGADAPGVGRCASADPLGAALPEPDRYRRAAGACCGPARDRPGDDRV
jgi:hypothetical protein